MRQMVKSNSAGHFSIGGKNGSTPSTPRKPRTPSKTTTPASGKGKYSETGDYAMPKSEPETIDSNDQSIKNEHATKTEDKDDSTVVKSGHPKRESESPATIFGEVDTMDNTASPSKRVCTPRTYRMPGMESEAGDSYSGDSSDPEFLPEGPGV